MRGTVPLLVKKKDGCHHGSAAQSWYSFVVALPRTEGGFVGDEPNLQGAVVGPKKEVRQEGGSPKKEARSQKV